MNAPELLAEVGVKSNVTLIIISMALLVTRILPVVIFSPFLGGEVVPTEVKIGLSVTLAGVLFPAVQPRIAELPNGALMLILLFGKELFVGVALAFVVSMVFEAAEIAGSLIDTFAGTTMAQVMVPQIQHQVSLFASLKVQLAVVLFLTLDGHHVVINALADSFGVVPLDRFPSFSSGLWGFFEVIIIVFGQMFRIAMALSAPALLATLLSDLGLGMINRVAPQIQVFFISMSVKPLATCVVMLSAIHLIIDRLGDEFRLTMTFLHQAIRLLG